TPRAARVCSLISGYLSSDQRLYEPRQLCVEELRHALLIAANRLRQLCGVSVPDLGCERLDPVVDRDLDVLLAELLLRVAYVGLGLIGHRGTSRADLTLHGCNCFARDLARRARHAGNGHGACFATKLLDSRGYAALVVAGLAQMLLKTFLIGRFVGKRDVRGQIGLELRLLGVSFV